MKYLVFSVYDRAAQVYGRPVYMMGLAQAVRSFTDEIRRVAPENEMNRHPGDFELQYLGSFEDGDASFVLEVKPQVVKLGRECVESGM